VASTLVVQAWTAGAGVGILTPYAMGILCALAWMGIRIRVERTA
jgi:hypothetical protein